MPTTLSQRDALLRLWVTPGVGPMLGRRLVGAFGQVEAIFTCPARELEAVRGIGPDKARSIASALHESEAALERELAEAGRAGAQVVTLGEPGYPPLLAQAPDAPLVLWFKGELPVAKDDYCVAIVGSRKCTAYGLEQSERFAAHLASAGLIVVSGGARGIDSAAHRASVRGGGRTIAVLGCGLSQCYPPENAELFSRIAGSGGAVVSELPMRTSPAPDNFPARNRIIAAMSLGTLVIEAPKGSGALITAKQAIDEYGREVMAVPGRIDSSASKGSNELLREGGAALVTSPSEVLEILEPIARHQFEGTDAARREDAGPASTRSETSGPPMDLSENQMRIYEALSGAGLTLSEICRATELEAHVVQAEVTVLEIRRVVIRAGGGVLERRG